MRIINCNGKPMIDDENSEFIRTIEKECSDIIDSGGEVLLFDLYDRLGIEHPKERYLEHLSLWGWDKGGFRQLYKLVMVKIPC